MQFVYRADGVMMLCGLWSHAQYLAGVVPRPFWDIEGNWVKPRVRVKMGRQKT